MGRGLVGDHVDRRAHGEHGRHQVGGVAEQPDRQRLARVPRRLRPAQRVGQVVGGHVEVAVLDPPGDPGRVAVDADRDPAVHRHRQRLRAAHPAQARGQRDRAGQRAAEPLLRHRGERLVGALEDALRADVDPRAGRHLAEHGQPQRLQPPELLPGRPLRHQQRVGDEHPRRPLVRPHHADRLAGLDQQGLVFGQASQAQYDRVVGGPAPCRAPGPAIDDELVGVLGHLGVKVVHEHPHGRLLWPAPAAQAGAARGADRAGTGRRASVRGIHDPSSSSGARRGKIVPGTLIILHRPALPSRRRVPGPWTESACGVIFRHGPGVVVRETLWRARAVARQRAVARW